MIEPQARASELRLEVRKEDPSLHFYGDAKRVEQIVLNLLSNAVKFTPAGGAVTVTTTSTPAEVHVHVKDTGVGISPEKLDQVFDPFFQVESQPIRTTRGTGLGLAISRELALAMRGVLTVESTPGAGSIFSLSLPRQPAPAAQGS